MAPNQRESFQSKSFRKSTAKESPTSWSMRIGHYNLVLTKFWRRYGVKVSFFFTFFVFWTGFKNIIVDHDPNSSSESFSRLQTLWLAAFRAFTLFIVNFTLPGFLSLLCYTWTGEGRDGADVDEDEDEDNNNTVRHEPLKLIVRIVTRGDYPKLIRDSVDFHENLFKSYWRHSDDELAIHIVSETALNLARPKRNGTVHMCEVKEFDIPPTYTTPNKTLFKARNNTFALARCLEEATLRQEPLERTWVISLDEDVFLTRRWLQEFEDTVLNRGADGEYKFVSSASRPVFLDETLGMNGNSRIPPIVPFFGEAFRLALDVSRVWWRAKLFGRSAVGIRGSCYGVRLDVEARVGYDCGGPFLSVGDDTTFFHRLMITPDAKLKFLDAWFLEGAPSTTFAFMKQRARWVRNHLYFLLFSRVPVLNKIQLASFLITWTVVMPCGAVVWGTGYILMALNGRAVDFFPCGPAWPFVDVICCASSACVIYWYTFGCALLLPWYWAVLVSLTFSTYMPVLPLHFIGAVAAVWGLISAVHELAARNVDFGITEKKVN